MRRKYAPPDNLWRAPHRGARYAGDRHTPHSLVKCISGGKTKYRCPNCQTDLKLTPALVLSLGARRETGVCDVCHRNFSYPESII